MTFPQCGVNNVYVYLYIYDDREKNIEHFSSGCSFQAAAFISPHNISGIFHTSFPVSYVIDGGPLVP